MKKKIKKPIRIIPVLDIKNGVVDIPTGPGWGVDIDTSIFEKHAWQKGNGPGYLSLPK